MTSAASIVCQALVLGVEGVWIAEASHLEAGGVRKFSKVNSVNNRFSRVRRVSDGGDVGGVKDNKIWPAV